MTDEVYNLERVMTPAPPAGTADDVGTSHFVPAPCQVACPIGTDAPSYLAYIWEGKLEKAFEAITATNPLSSICGRVCDAPCEPACRRADSDGPIAIRNLKRFVMDRLGADYKPPVVQVSRPESIGIVGGGPAGLTAAQDLAAAGFSVAIYEMTDRLGGMAAWGIPEFRLPDGTIAEDIDRLLAGYPGIEVHTNSPLGDAVTLADLKQRHDAVLLAIGAWWGKTMTIPGADHPGVIDGVGFLRQVNAGDRPELPESVVVIGGGDVAMDACRAAKRLPGCNEVTVVYRRGPDEIPARKDELEGAVKEDIAFTYHTQPVAVVKTESGLALRCRRTELGEPDEDGRRRPVEIAGSEHDMPCGMVIMAIGQQAESAELDRLGMMAKDRVATDWDGMRTADPNVFAAGDGAFGGSTLVMAMQHGHRAAYYIKAHLDGIDDPIPYRTPFRTRRVPIAQDANWEVFPRIDAAFHGLGDNPVQFSEIESTYTAEEARDEAARCYRCDIETGSADYSVSNREDIFVMARARAEDGRLQNALLRKRLKTRADPFGIDWQPTMDDLVFLPANLSRLVIDPYRDACNTATRLFDAVGLASPFLVTGFDTAPEQVRRGIAAGIAAEGSAYLGRRPLADDVPWIQICNTAADIDPAAAATALRTETGLPPDGERPAPIGLIASAYGLREAIKTALANDIAFLLLEGNGPIDDPWPECTGAPDLTLLRDTIAIMRAMNREEDLEILYFGGVRTGTDGAKLLAQGANAAIIGLSMAFALGGSVEGLDIMFRGDYSDADRADGAACFLRSLSAEASIMARCTGKTDVHNLEPEDLRAITCATAEATGLPLAGARISAGN